MTEAVNTSEIIREYINGTPWVNASFYVAPLHSAIGIGRSVECLCSIDIVSWTGTLLLPVKSARRAGVPCRYPHLNS